MKSLHTYLLTLLLLTFARTGFGQEHTRVNKNYTLYSGRTLYSTDGRYKLSMQQDGNLVLYKEANGVRQALWSSNTSGRAVRKCVFQVDGNLVTYDYEGRPVWASQSGGKDGAYMLLQNDGNLVIYTSQDQAIWATNTFEKN